MLKSEPEPGQETSKHVRPANTVSSRCVLSVALSKFIQLRPPYMVVEVHEISKRVFVGSWPPNRER